MIARAHEWTTNYADGPGGTITVVLRHVDVGDVRGTIRVVVDDDPADPTIVELGPLALDELEDVAALIADAAADAGRWSTDTSR